MCRQSAFRLRRQSTAAASADELGIFAYADPPYPGRAKRLYGLPDVDLPQLIDALQRYGYTGWALSTSADALRTVLPLCPPHARVCSWVKPIGVSTRTHGPHNAWEPLIVVGGRRRRPGVRDWLSAQPARRGGTLAGRKPLKFCAWLFQCLGMVRGDELVDIFPGTRIVSRAWAELSPGSSATDRPSERAAILKLLATEGCVSLERLFKSHEARGMQARGALHELELEGRVRRPLPNLIQRAPAPPSDDELRVFKAATLEGKEPADFARATGLSRARTQRALSLLLVRGWLSRADGRFSLEPLRPRPSR